jgi:hypothetical protein
MTFRICLPNHRQQQQQQQQHKDEKVKLYYLSIVKRLSRKWPFHDFSRRWALHCGVWRAGPDITRLARLTRDLLLSMGLME